MSQAVIDLLQSGQAACENDKWRKDNLILLPSKGTLIATGDIHGHRRNFERIATYADLENNPGNHVLLQEIIHGGEADVFGRCLSYQLLLDVIEYKVKFPDQVHIVLGNHDTTFINNSRVMKGGREMNQAFRDALDDQYGKLSEDVKLAMRQFMFAQPLAIKCENGLWLSHSLPADRFAKQFDETIFKRQLRINDIVKPGDAYILTWGRRMSQESLDDLAKRLGVKGFVLGHQAQPDGFSKAGNNLIIIASDHNHGCLLPIDLSRSYSTDELVESVVPLASIA